MNLSDIPLNDEKTFRLLSAGMNTGVFQFEAPWIRGILRDIKPSSITEIATVTALIRPGSLDSGGPREYADRKRSGDTISDIHPEIDSELSECLAETYGVLVFQEQVLEIIRIVTGWDYGEADLLFYAFRKKKLEKLSEAKPAFFAASKYSRGCTQAVWDRLVSFGDYGFNKSHAIGYAYITYYTAYLKANHPVEFISALLSGEDDQAKIKEYIGEARRLGIDILPPDVNQSDLGFTPSVHSIRYGLSAIKGVGDNGVAALRRSRPFSDLNDFLRRADPKVLNAGVLSALARSGALDTLWPSRLDLLDEVDRLSGLAQKHRKASAEGSRTLFEFYYTPKIRHDSAEADKQEERLSKGELEALGVRLTFPPIILVTDRLLTESERSWLLTVLNSRTGESQVYLETNGFRVRLPIRSAKRGLASAVSKIGIRVE